MDAVSTLLDVDPVIRARNWARAASSTDTLAGGWLWCIWRQSIDRAARFGRGRAQRGQGEINRVEQNCSPRESGRRSPPVPRSQLQAPISRSSIVIGRVPPTRAISRAAGAQQHGLTPLPGSATRPTNWPRLEPSRWQQPGSRPPIPWLATAPSALLQELWRPDERAESCAISQNDW
jgi:hypothetical protein